MTPCVGGRALGFLIFSCSWCWVCMQAHTLQYVTSAMQSRMSAARSMSSFCEIMAAMRKMHASWLRHSMKPMRKLSHGVFSTRISSWIMNLFVATADGKQQNASTHRQNSGQDFSPHRPEMHVSPLQQV